ncbi:MAG: prolyl oligopeptidase family serine peptidase [Betaproteobacteria bacterium]|nr:prolyl oligopeptidase family serine peptidase [Betaproteobacteria bacterium]
MQHIVSAPPATGPLPLLCFLHGYGEAAPMAIERALRRHGPLAAGAAPVAVRGFIVLAPQLPIAGDLWGRHADQVLTLIDDVCARQAVDATRMYLTGFSYGGNGVFDLALAQPDRWAALWSVDPTRVPQRAPKQPLWLSAGDVARAQHAPFVRALRLGAKGERVWADDGEDHVGSARLAYGDERIYRWLLSFARA